MLVTLPLVPVFMWLIGRYTERRTQERWQALSLLATHFADVVRGLPTLRAFNRSRAQAEQIAAVERPVPAGDHGDATRRIPLGAVLELAATLGIALVAVTVGVRLVDGGLGFEAGLTVLVLAPELYAPLRNLAAQFHASADGAAVAGRMLDLIDARPTVPHGREAAPDLRTTSIRLENVGFRYPAGRYRCCRGSTSSWSRVRRSLWSGRADPERARSPPCCFACPSPARAASPREAPTSPVCAGGVAPAAGMGAAAADAAARDGRGEHPTRRPFRNRRPGPGSGRACRCRRASYVSSPSGYDTLVGDGGRPLSAGQTQRIALARAFLRDAPFVVLDEPTANLDPASAEIVADAIDQLGANRTVLLIVHRPELAARADRVVRLDSGRVVEPLVEAVA